MIRLILFLVGILAVATALAWLADHPGTITVDWLGYRAEPSVFQAVVGLLLVLATTMLLWSLLRQMWMSPAVLGRFLAKRRQRRGLDALSSGMIAVGAGDRANATRYALQARKALPNEPLTHLLRAQAAQLSGDRATARRIFEAMLASPDTEPLGLRGLYLEAHREQETEAERQFAERAHKLNPTILWPAEAIFDLACKERRWGDALETLAVQRKHGTIDKSVADRRRAVLLAARAQSLEEGSPDKAFALAVEAHGLAPDLIPAAAIAGRILASRGNTAKAAKVIQKTWVRAPHPDLAAAYAYARIGDSPRDRLDRIKQLGALNPRSAESAVAIAGAAIEARQFDIARRALEPWLGERMTRRIALLMARIEGEDLGDKGRVREWLARAAHAARDPAWTADGVVAEDWQPVSPVTGQLDAFRWRVPVEEREVTDIENLAAEFDALGAGGGVSVIDVEAAGTAVAGDRAVAVAGEPAAASKAPAVPTSKGEDVEVQNAEVRPEPGTAAPAEFSIPAPAAAPVAAPSTAAPTAIAPAPAAVEAEASTAKPSAPALAPEPPGTPEPPTARTKSQGKPGRTGKPKAEARIFVSPPAPDDPGAGPEDVELPRGTNPYRAAT